LCLENVLIKDDPMISTGLSIKAEEVSPILSNSNKKAFTDLPSKAGGYTCL